MNFRSKTSWNRMGLIVLSRIGIVTVVRPILNLLAQNDDDLLSDLTELEGATNERLLGESGRLLGISAIELVSGFRLPIS